MRAHQARTLDEVPQSFLLRSSFQRADREMLTAFEEAELQEPETVYGTISAIRKLTSTLFDNSTIHAATSFADF